MIEKKRIVFTPNLYVRSFLLLVIILPVLVLWIAGTLMASTVKAALYQAEDDGRNTYAFFGPIAGEESGRSEETPIPPAAGQ